MFNKVIKDMSIVEDIKRGRIVAKIKEMSPNEYILECSNGYGVEYDTLVLSRDKNNVNKIQEKLENGIKMDCPYLLYDGNKFKQDGLHRAIASLNIGVKKIPVIELRYGGCDAKK